MQGFNREAVEKLYSEKGLDTTKEDIEAIVGELNINDELKAEDAQGDLITLMRTMTVEGQEVVNYQRRTTREEADKFEFQIIVSEPEAE